MTDHTPLPASLKKRRVGRGVTGLVALVAGVALALLAFTLNQDGFASTTPANEANKGDVTVTELRLENVQQGTQATVQDGGPADADPFDFTFSNTSDEPVGVTVYEIVPAGAYGPDQQALFESLYVTMTAEGDEEAFFTGRLSDLGSTPEYVGSVPAGTVQDPGTLTIDVKAATDLATATAQKVEIEFDVKYYVDEPGKGASTPPPPPTTQPPAEESRCDAFADAGDDFVEGCKTILTALGIEEGEPSEGEGSQCDAFADLGEQAVDACKQFLQAIGLEEGEDDGETETPECAKATGPLSGQIQSLIDQMRTGDPTEQGGPLFEALEQVNCQLIVALEDAGQGFPPA